MTHPSWVALWNMAHNFIELYRSVVHMINLISFLWLWFSFWPLKDKDKRLVEASWWERLTVGEAGCCSDGRVGMLSKSLIHFSVDGWDCFLSLLFDLRPNYGGSNEDSGDVLQMVSCMHCHTQCLWSCIRLLLTHASTGDSWTLTGKSGLVSCGVTAPFSWVLVCTQCFVCALQGSVFPVLCKSNNQIPLASKVKFPGGPQSLYQILRFRNPLWVIELFFF